MQIRNRMMGRHHGSSLIEMTVVTLLVAVAVGFSLHFILSVETESAAKQRQAREGILLINNAIGAYTLDYQTTAPSTLNTLIEKGYFESMLLDPWGNEYQYQNPGQYAYLDIWSRGPDGVDSEDDIVGWDPYGSYVR